MSENTNFGFAKLVPGFDFLQNLTKGASQSMPSLSNWVAPTLSVEELDKRITELKAVHFWLDQNSKALLATIQALEVQKMTLATLQGMNFSMGELANALKLKPSEEVKPEPAASAPAAAAPKASAAGEKAAGKPKARGREGNGAAGAAVDPLQWWGALTHQFQEIAANAMKDVAQKTATDMAAANAASVGKEPGKAAAKKGAPGGTPRKAATKRAKAS